MKSVHHLKFFQRQENRLIVTLTLSVLYPICCAAMFAAFIFVILPITPIVNSPKPLLYFYWCAAAGIWLLLLAIFLPLMRDNDLDNVMTPTQRESGINLKRVTLKGSNDLLQEDYENSPRKSNINSLSDESDDESDMAIKAEKETLLESEFKSSPFQQRLVQQSSGGSPPRERIMISSELLNETDFSFDDSIVKVHAADDCTYHDRAQSTDNLSKNALLDPKKFSDKNRKSLSNQNLRAISREDIKNISLDNISRVKEDRICVTDECVETLCEKLATEIKQSKLTGRKFKIDIVKSETVYEYSLPTPEPLSPNSMQNTVFLYVNKD